MRDFVFEKFYSGTTVDLHPHISWDFRCQIREAAHVGSISNYVPGIRGCVQSKLI